MQRALLITQNLLIRYGDHSAFAAFEPVNAPWEFSPIDMLFDFYREVRKQVQRYAPQAKFVFSDAGILDYELWNTLFLDSDMQNVVLDTHYTTAFRYPGKTVLSVCVNAFLNTAAYIDSVKYSVWFGEWSLGTDNCP